MIFLQNGKIRKIENKKLIGNSMSLQFYKSIKNEIDTQKYLNLSSSYSSNTSLTQVQYLNTGFDLYVIMPENSKLAQQVEYNPEVQVIFDTVPSGKSKGIIYKGVIEKITDKEENYEYAKKFARKFRRFKGFFFSRNTFLFKIKPIEIKQIQFDQIKEENVLTFKENTKSVLEKLNFKIKTVIKTWIEATRLPFVTASFGSVFLGTTVAWAVDGVFNLNLFLLTLLGALFVHLGANMLNDFYDHITGNDAGNLFYNELTGGSRVIQKGIFSPEKVILSSIVLLLAGSGIGLYLNAILPGNILLVIGLVGIFFTVGYSTPVLKFSYRGIGEIVVGLAFGMVTTVGSYFVQTGSLNSTVFIASVPLSIFVFLILFINEFQDYRADKASGKKTLVVRIGDKWKAMKVYSIIIFLPYIWVIPFVIFGFLPLWSLIIFITLPMAIIAVKNGSTKYRRIYELLIVNKLTIILHLLISILLSLAFVLDKIL